MQGTRYKKLTLYGGVEPGSHVTAWVTAAVPQLYPVFMNKKNRSTDKVFMAKMNFE